MGEAKVGLGVPHAVPHEISQHLDLRLLRIDRTEFQMIDLTYFLPDLRCWSGKNGMHEIVIGFCEVHSLGDMTR